MAVYDPEEQEQISRIKGWWEENGNIVTGIVVAAALAVLAWQGTNWYQNKRATEAGALYFLVQQAVQEGDASRAQDASGRLIDEFPGTPYAQMAALMTAGFQFAQGNRADARSPLEWLAANGDDAVLRDIARLRLATILLDEGAHAEALERLEEASHESLRARFVDLRGDVLAADGQADRARAAYQEALDLLASTRAQGADALAEVVRIKLESLES